MSSLLNDSEKASLVSDFQSVVDTFLRPLTVYQEAQRTLIVTDPNFNPIDAWNQNSTGIQNLPIANVISGRIMYDKNQEWNFIKPFVGRGQGEGAIKVKDQTTRAVRLKVDASGAALLATAKKVEFDGVLFDLESQPRPHGLFTPNYYTFYFVRSM